MAIKRMTNEMLSTGLEMWSRLIAQGEAKNYSPLVSEAEVRTYADEQTDILHQIDEELGKLGFEGLDVVERFNHLLETLEARGVRALPRERTSDDLTPGEQEFLKEMGFQ